MPDYSSAHEMLLALKEQQDVEFDNRERVREAHLFLNKRDGQWEPHWWEASTGKPRYTFDMTTPVIDQISGEMAQADFDIAVKPIGGDASKDDANLLDGLVRNIEAISNATDIYNQAGRSMVVGGLDGWRINTKFVDDDSFDQDIVIEHIPNFSDRAWFGPSEKQDKSDAPYGFLLHALSKEEYKDRWPEGSEQSIPQDRSGKAYYHTPDIILVCEVFYTEQKERTLILMENGAVYEDGDDYKLIADELRLAGINEKRRRKRKDNIIYSRLMDGSDWLEPEKETVFNWVPLVPCMANFEIFEDKTLYHGAVEKLIDYQRVYNYSKSREIEEGSLAPRAKYWMTEKQVEGHTDTLATLNTNSDPVQIYNHDSDVPGPPQQSGGAQINPGLVNISQSMEGGIARAAGLFAANMGESVNNQSGVALKALQDKGNIGTIKFFKAMEVAIAHTGKIIIKAIPKVYDTQRQVRVLSEDGSFSMKTLNETLIDNQTGQVVTLNDLSKGKYDVTCSSGPAFQSKQEETVAAITEMANVDPSIIQQGGDILFGNITAPGMDLLAERKRRELFQAGLIPVEQMTEEEKQEYQQIQQQNAQNPPPPDAMMVAAQAEMQKAQNEQGKIQIDGQLRSQELQLKQQQLQQNETKMALQEQSNQIDAMFKQQKQQMDLLTSATQQMKSLTEAFGVETMDGQIPSNLLKQQALLTDELQDKL